MPCLIPAGYFNALLERLNTPHELDDGGERLRAERRGKYQRLITSDWPRTDVSPCSKETTMNREVTGASYATDSKTLFKEYRILFAGDSGYVNTNLGKDCLALMFEQMTGVWQTANVPLH